MQIIIRAGIAIGVTAFSCFVFLICAAIIYATSEAYKRYFKNGRRN